MLYSILKNIRIPSNSILDMNVGQFVQVAKASFPRYEEEIKRIEKEDPTIKFEITERDCKDYGIRVKITKTLLVEETN